jgi:hypothetical protein
MKKTSEGRASASVFVDYPQEGERIRTPFYSFSIEGPASNVEIAIDGEDWRPCRKSGGYWRYDWSGYAPGRHQAIVRGESYADREPAVTTRRFVVDLPRAARR